MADIGRKTRGVDFETTPEGILEFRNDKGQLDIDPMLSVYHFLKTRLEYNPELDKQYREFADDLDHVSAKMYVDSIGGRGFYGRGPALFVNTANEEDLLSQVLQYVYWEDEDGAHILLQIHGGAIYGEDTPTQWFLTWRRNFRFSTMPERSYIASAASFGIPIMVTIGCPTVEHPWRITPPPTRARIIPFRPTPINSPFSTMNTRRPM